MVVPPRRDVLGRLRERVDGLGGRDDGFRSPLWDAARGDFGLERSFKSLRGLGEERVRRGAAHSRNESLAHREAMYPRNV